MTEKKLIRPMLAVDAEEIRFPCWGSPKIDGVRALIVDGRVMSRSMKEIPNAYVQHLFGREEMNGLDGELVVGDANDPNCMQKTMSGVTTRAGEPDVKYYVFDKWDTPDLPYHRRHLLYKGQLTRIAEDFANGTIAQLRIGPVPQTVLTRAAELEDFERYCLEVGYEGVMIRDPNAPYKFGRSTAKQGYLLKVKRFSDSEAEVIGYEELMHNANEATTNELGYKHRSSHKDNKVPMNKLGSLLVRDNKSGVEFNIGTGFTDTQRYQLWGERKELLGRIVTYKFFAASGIVEKPRFPTFKAFRDPLDT